MNMKFEMKGSVNYNLKSIVTREYSDDCILREASMGKWV